MFKKASLILTAVVIQLKKEAQWFALVYTIIS